MAKKIQLVFPFDALASNDVTREENKIQGYECGFLAVFQSPVTKLWRVVHKYTYESAQFAFYYDAEGKRHENFKGWKQKRQALAYAEEIQKHGLQFDVTCASEFQTRNDRALMDAAYNAAMKAANGKETKE